MKPGEREQLIYDWNRERQDAASLAAPIEFNDETLRDGLQSPSARHPSLDDKLKLVHLMDALGIHSANVGLPAAGGSSMEHITRLAEEMTRLRVHPNVACRTLLADIRPVVDIVQKTGAPIEVCAFIGSSPVRQYVEGWQLASMIELTREAVSFCVAEGLPCMFVTEDTTRAKPEDLRALYGAAIEAGAERICVSDTVGHATPEGVTRLITFIRELCRELGAAVGIDWHGHRDRGLALVNALAALDAGATRLHGTALGIGERVGNTEMDLLLINLRIRGCIDNDLSSLSEYCQLASRAIGIPLPYNYPVFGKDAFETATGVHAAAVIKAFDKGDTWLANRVYSGVPAEMVGLDQIIRVGPMSGRSNVIYILEQHGIQASEQAIDRVLHLAKSTSRLLTQAEILAVVGARSTAADSADSAGTHAESTRLPLEAHEELYRRIFEDSSDAIVIADARTGSVRHANATALALYGYTMDHMARLLIDDLCATPAPADADRFPVPLMQLHVKRGGIAFPVEVSIANLTLSEREGAMMILMVRDVSEREAYEQRLRYLGQHDLMTDLPNQSTFWNSLQRALGVLHRTSKALAVAVLNLDRFRAVNDAYGPKVGDLVIGEIARRLRSCVRDTDTLCRSGGDEFALLLEDTLDSDEVAQVCQRILELVARPVEVAGHTVHTSGSIGIGIRDPGLRNCDARQLYSEATSAMKSVREAGGNDFRFYSAGTDDAVRARRVLEMRLREALQEDQFLLHYQPQLKLDDATMTMEALIRWQHPEHGLVPPASFISALEDTSLIVPVGKWVLRSALQQLKRWQTQGLPVAGVAVNVSARQISFDWLDVVRAELAASGIAAGALTLEITETVLLESSSEGRSILDQLDELGARISLDDFGTGYSSLSYLKRLPIRELKIDRSFVADLARNADSRAIVGAILSLSKSLSLPVVVEGVETREQLGILRGLGGTCIQGYLLARPMSEDVVDTWLRARSWHEFLS